MSRPPIAGAAFVLLVVSLLALEIRVTHAPWYWTALVGVFAVKWVLLLLVPQPERTP